MISAPVAPAVFSMTCSIAEEAKLPHRLAQIAAIARLSGCAHRVGPSCAQTSRFTDCELAPQALSSLAPQTPSHFPPSALPVWQWRREASVY